MGMCLGEGRAGGDTAVPYSYSHRCRGHIYCPGSEEICVPDGYHIYVSAQSLGTDLDL